VYVPSHLDYISVAIAFSVKCLNLSCNSFPFISFQPENGYWLYFSLLVICSVVVRVYEDESRFCNAG
jgi:hypothetical protein